MQKLLDEEKIRVETDNRWRQECELARKKWDLEAKQYEQEQNVKISNYKRQIEDEYKRSINQLDATEQDMQR